MQAAARGPTRESLTCLRGQRGKEGSGKVARRVQKSAVGKQFAEAGTAGSFLTLTENGRNFGPPFSNKAHIALVYAPLTDHRRKSFCSLLRVFLVPSTE